jgi:serine/threonine protein kinase/tetratricopeptide (TPR) repeat protein
MADSSYLVGKLISHYRIVEKIGAGGMGEVYRAHDETLERDVALKVLPPGVLTDSGARKRFRKEALALARLNHPNIATIYEYASHNDVDFLAMELISGVTLSQKLNGDSLTEKEILSVGTQIAEALSAAHEQGVLHCDLKPGNVMLMPNGQAKVLDFGLARFFHNPNDPLLTETLTETQIAGTLPYMSPEQVCGKRVDGRSDIYAAGVVLFEISTGRRPFPETNAASLIDAILHQQPDAPSSMNPLIEKSLDRVILTSLEKSPESRFQSARDLAVELTRLSSPSLSIARPGPKRKSRVWLFGPAAMILTVIILLGLSVTRYFLSRHKSVAVATVPKADFSKGKRIALLPIRVEGDQALIKYIADGLVQSLRVRLFQVSDLCVAGKYNENHEIGQSVTKVANDLGANLVLQGILSGTPQKLRLDLHLQNATDAQPFWTKEFSGANTDLPALEDQIFDQLLVALDVSSAEDERFRALMRPVVSADAYELYFKGLERMKGKFNAQNTEEAINFFDEALKKDHNFDMAYLGLADANLRMHSVKKEASWLQKALAAARRAVEINDKLPEAHMTLGNVYNLTGQGARAIAELRRGVELAPNSDEAYRRLGTAYLVAEMKDLAIPAFQKAVTINPYFWENANSLGLAYMTFGEKELALKEFQTAIQLEPGNSDSYGYVGMVYLSLGRYEDGMAEFKKSLELQPSVQAYSNLATALFYLRRYSEAVPMFEKAVALDRLSPWMMGNFADSYYFLGNKDKARMAYEQAIMLSKEQLKTQPRNSDVFGKIALYYAHLGKAKEADDFLARAKASHKADSREVPSLADVQASIEALLGRKEKALNTLHRGIINKTIMCEDAALDPVFDNLRDTNDFKAIVAKCPTATF